MNQHDGQGPPGGPAAPPQQPGWGAPQQQGGPPQQPGWGVPQQPPAGWGTSGAFPPMAPMHGVPLQPGLLQPQGSAMPGWARVVARIGLAIGLLLVVATIAGGIQSESLGVSLAMLTGAPLGFGVVATLLTPYNARGGPGKPLGIGCGAGIVLSILVWFFFAAIFPAL